MFKKSAKLKQLSYPQSVNTYSAGLELFNTVDKSRKSLKKQIDIQNKLRYLQA